MLPRSKGFACALIFFVLSVFPCSALGDDNILIQFYQDHISAVDGNRCPMTPSCSAYAKKALEKHGTLLGTVMAMDRLVRCGRDEAGVSPVRVIANQRYIYDPIENNDFWWFFSSDKENDKTDDKNK